MASATSSASLSGPQILVESDRLVIKNGVVNNKNVSYNITITFQSGGGGVMAPDKNFSKSLTLARDVSSLAQRILKSLPPEFDGENLEKLGFLVQDIANESKPDTAILVSNTVQPVLDSWRSGNSEAFSRTNNPIDIPLHYDGTEFDEESKPPNVHTGLIELRSYFEAEHFLAIKHKNEAPSPAAPARSNIAVSLAPSAPRLSSPSTILQPFGWRYRPEMKEEAGPLKKEYEKEREKTQ